MEIYGQTDEIIVREMTENDCADFLALMAESGKNIDYSVEEVQFIWKLRRRKGGIQCTVTSADGAVIYGFCGIVYSKLYADFFAAYSGRGYAEPAERIIKGMFLQE